MPLGRVIWEGEQRAGWGEGGQPAMALTGQSMPAFLGASEGSRGGLLCPWPLRGPHLHLQRGLCCPGPQPCCPQPGVVGAWLLSSHASMSVRGPCGRREGGDGLYPWTDLSCKECVALVESQDLRPGFGGQMALGRSTGGSPKLRVGAGAARALSRLEPFLLPSPPSEEEGRSEQQRCGAGATWVVEDGLAVHPTGATPDPGGSFLLSGRWDALFPKVLIPSSLGRMLPSLSLFFMENNSGTEKSRREVRICLLPSLSSPSTCMNETPSVATLTF